MTPEGRIKQQIKAVLKAAGAYKFMPVQNGMGDPALDFFVCHRGWFIAIEAKAPGKKPTPRQEDTMADICAAQGITLVVSNEEELEILRDLLAKIPHAHS